MASCAGVVQGSLTPAAAESLDVLTPEVLDNLLSCIHAQIEHLDSKGSTFNFNAVLSQWDQRKEILTNFKISIPQELTKEVPQQSKDVLIMPLVQTAMGGIGTMHWLGLGCLCIAWSLECINQTSPNYEDILHMLRRTIDLLKHTSKIWKMNRDTNIQELQHVVEKAFQCALICTSDVTDSYVLRFLNAPTTKDAISRLKEEINAIKIDKLNYVTIENTPKLESQLLYPNIKENIGLPRSLSSYLWENSLDLLEEVWTTTFMQGVREGNMDPNFYGAFIMQDAVWCHEISEVWGCIARNESVPQELQDIGKQWQGSYFKCSDRLFRAFNVKDDGVNMGPAAKRYVEIVRNATTQYGAPYIMIATYACVKLWAIIIEDLAKLVNSSNPYYVWVCQNTGSSSSIRQASQVDEWDQKHQWYDWTLSLSIFRQAMRGEIDLFNLQTVWPMSKEHPEPMTSYPHTHDT